MTPEQKLAWRIVVRPREGDAAPIEMSDPDDGRAVELAYAEAQKRGWVAPV